MGLRPSAIGSRSGKRKRCETAKPIPTGGLQLPLSLDKETITILQHVIRTPLTSIRSFAEILLDYPVEDAESQRRFLKIILEEAKRLTHVLDVVLGSTEATADAGSAEESSVATGVASASNESWYKSP
jgi:signal transduction histidine kinase